MKMAADKYISKTREYLDYLEEHISNVRKAYIEFESQCSGLFLEYDMDMGRLANDVFMHDVSKFSAEEFVQYREYFYPLSDYEKSKANIDGAWEHHKNHNHHHWETVDTLYDISHMVIDWTAMGYKFGDTAETYYRGVSHKVTLQDHHERFLEAIFKALAQ